MEAWKTKTPITFMCVFSSEPHRDVIPIGGYCLGSSRGPVGPAAGKLFLQLLPAGALLVLLWQPVQLPAVPGKRRRQHSSVTETVSLLTTAVFLIGDRLPPEIRAEMIDAAHYDIINLL